MARANETLTSIQHAQDRAARELRQATERLQRSEEAVSSARHSLGTEQESAGSRLTELRERARTALGTLPEELLAAWNGLIVDPGNQALADGLHASWVAGDEQLSRFEVHVRRIELASAATAAARQVERDATSQHEATTRAVQTVRQALWSRWDRMIKRWPENFGAAPEQEPSTILLPPLVDTCQAEIMESQRQMREALARSARAEFRIAEIAERQRAIEAEMEQTQSEPLPLLSAERERALVRLQAVDRSVAPVYRHLDLAREGVAWGEAIEGLLDHLDLLTLLILTIPLEQARATLGSEADWHVLLSNPESGKVQRGSLASVLVTSQPELRRYLDAALGGVTLAQEPQRSGDYLCPDGRYRLGDLTGAVRKARRSESLIGVVRRQAAAAARRDELLQEQRGLMREIEDLESTRNQDKQAASDAEAQAHALGELAHMLEEIDQRRAEMRTLREADDAASVRLAAATREAEDAAADEEDERSRWADATRSYPALADPAHLTRSRLTLSEAVADAVTRAAETRNRLSQLRTRLRSAEDSHGAENEVYGMARAHMEEVDNEVQEAQRILNQARSALQAAGLQNVEARITQLQRRLKTRGRPGTPDGSRQGYRAAPGCFGPAGT